MPTTTATTRRLDLEVVLVGTADGGASSALRRLHAAWTPHARGEVACVERGSGGVVCDYAPLDLPRWGGKDLRAHVYTMGAGEGLRGAQRRILAGADAVIFVADARRGALERNIEAWRELGTALAALDERGTTIPIHVAANFGDAPDALDVDDISARLRAEAPGRALLGFTSTRAHEGDGLLTCFSSVVGAAATVAQAPASGDSVGARASLVAALGEQFRGSAQRPAAPTPGAQARRVQLPSAQGISDGTGLNMALDVSRWLALRELDVRRLQRERALGGLLLEVGQTCLSATDVEGLAPRVLSALAMNLEAVSGWLGLPDGAGLVRVYDPMGVSSDGSAFAETAEALGMGVRDGSVSPVGPETGALLPGGAVGGRGLFAPFSVGDGRRGWLLLVGPPDRGLPEDAEAVLATAGAFVGLTLARLRALQRLRENNVALEGRVEARTQELRHEKELLEARVRERGQEIEAAKKATLEAERRLLDQERNEGLQRLAAGLAHELNNPLGAALANLEFTLEGLQRLSASVAGLVGAELADLVTAAQDARRDLRRVSTGITSLCGRAATTRREAVRTHLANAVKDAVQRFAQAGPGRRVPRVQVLESVSCGVPPAECSRWLFRLLTAVGQGSAAATQIDVARGVDGPRLRVRVEGDVSHAAEAIGALRAEIERAGGRLTLGRADASPGGAVLELTLPPALGESVIYDCPLATEVA